MSKKGGKKQKMKAPDMDPGSPEWKEETEKKKAEAYEMVQRAMIRSQMNVMYATRDDLLSHKSNIEAKMKQQSQDQNDIYQYLRKKLRDNYVAIAELENQVSCAHEDRLKQEKILVAKANELETSRESEKARLLERLGDLGTELEAVKEFQDNSAVYGQKVRDLEARITASKETFTREVAQLNAQIEEEWETGLRDKEEKINITKKAAAKATQEQLDSRTKHMIVQNKKMMGELRFQCCEVEKMIRAREGLLRSNTLLLAQAASARHVAEELARRSHLLQRIIRYMHQKRQERARTECIGSDSETRASASDSTADRACAEGSTAPYKLAGMSQEDRQQLLDLREELRREEIGIAATQALVDEKRQELAEESRAFALKVDLARVLALIHKDPALGERCPSSGARAIAAAGVSAQGRASEPKHPLPGPFDFLDSQPGEGFIVTGVSEDIRGKPSSDDNGTEGFEGVEQSGRDSKDAGRRRRVRAEDGTDVTSAVGAESSVKVLQSPAPSSSSRVDLSGADRKGISVIKADLPIWPEDLPLEFPAAEGAEVGVSEEHRGEHDPARHLDLEVLKAVLRLFLSKLQVSVEMVTPRRASAATGPTSLPMLAGCADNSSDCNRVAGEKSRKKGRRRNGTGPRRREGDHGRKDGWPSDGGMSKGIAESTARHGSPHGMLGESPDSLWSGRVTTGIPSWDMLQLAVRQTKRRRTRDVACQTLTYRELRDHATAGGVSSTCATSPWGKNSSTTTLQADAHVCYPGLSKGVAKAAALRSPTPLSTTASGASVFRRTPDGGAVHGAVVRGGLALEVEKQGSGCIRSKERPAAGNTPHGQSFVHLGMVESCASPIARIGGAGAPAAGSGRESHVIPVLGPSSSAHRHDASGDRDGRQPAPVKQVSVSWGEEERSSKVAAKATRAAWSNAKGPGSSKWTPHRNEGDDVRIGEAIGRDSSGQFGGGDARHRNDNFTHPALSKRPDYRKVLLFTVEDDDRRNMRRPPALSAAPRCGDSSPSLALF